MQLITAVVNTITKALGLLDTSVNALNRLANTVDNYAHVIEDASSTTLKEEQLTNKERLDILEAKIKAKTES